MPPVSRLLKSRSSFLNTFSRLLLFDRSIKFSSCRVVRHWATTSHQSSLDIPNANCSIITSLIMRLHYPSIAIVLSSLLTTALAVPFSDSTIDTSPKLDLEARDPISKWRPRSLAPTPSSCPTQNPISSNVCSSGSPYCCSGSGKSVVCGPASTTQCTSTTICCINTNGVN